MNGRFFLPTYGRPERLRAVLDACVKTGMTEKLTVIVNGNDQREAYSEVLSRFAHFIDEHVQLKENLGFNGAMQWALENHPDLDWYGCMADDCVPLSQGWDKAAVHALNKQVRIVSVDDGWQSPKRISPITVFSGELIRAMGFWFLPGLWSFRADDIIEQIGRDFDCWRTLPREVAACEHRHYMNGKAEKDPTYELSYSQMKRRAEDERAYNNWLASGRAGVYERVGLLLARTVEKFDFSKIKLCICMPIADRPYPEYTAAISASGVLLQRLGVNVRTVKVIGGSDIEKVRDSLLWKAMSTDATHFLFADDDMGWAPDVPARLLAADLEFVGVVGMKKTELPEYAFSPIDGDQRFDSKSNFLEVKNVGFGFVLLKRSAVEKLCAAYPELEYHAGPTQKQFALFMHLIEPTDSGEPGQYLSEDLSFCHRWRAIGGKIYVDQNAALDHVGRKVYTGRVSDLFQYEDRMVRKEAAD